MLCSGPEAATEAVGAALRPRGRPPAPALWAALPRGCGGSACSPSPRLVPPLFLGPMLSVLKLLDSDFPADVVWVGGGVSLSTGLRCDVAAEACQLQVCMRAYTHPTHTMELW